jgi:hypothetical protein
VPKNTAFRWARDPQVRKVVEDFRRRAIDEAVGQMTYQFKDAARVIHRTCNDADSPVLRFRAARAIISDMITMSKYSGLEARLLEVEQMVEPPKQAGGPGTDPWGHAKANYGLGAANAPAARQISPGGTGAG